MIEIIGIGITETDRYKSDSEWGCRLKVDLYRGKGIKQHF